ncbi:MAG: FISUMP domain-containing protein [Bacteroidales bacterium]
MKKLPLFYLFLLPFVITLNAQEISFSFTAKHTCEYAASDSVLIENLTQGGDTTLYFPDTVLTINLSGIESIYGGQNGFSVSQNYPNPFETKTEIDIFVPERDDFTLNVYDISGRKIANYKGTHERGMHHFTFFSGNAKSYILTVSSGKYLQHIQMIQFGEAGSTSPYIEYHGSTTTEEPEIIQKSLRSYFPYDLEDELKYTAYVSGDYASTTDTPSASVVYFFDINNTTPSTTTAGIHVPSEEQIQWNWNTVSDADGYKYNTIDDYSTATDIGTSTSYTQTGLDCETSYTLYVWAYNTCGESSSLELTETTSDCPPSCLACGGTADVVDVANPDTGKTWMDRNLGACQQATASDDYLAYGAIYQWGRLSDGHECITWTGPSSGTPVNGITAINSSSDVPGHSSFIMESNSPNDWRIPQNDDLWEGVSGINNPCPSGYRLPTETELNNEWQSWSTNDTAGAFASPLKLTVAGGRIHGSGELYSTGSYGYYWSSTAVSTAAHALRFTSSEAGVQAGYRAYGFVVRCIKD